MSTSIVSADYVVTMNSRHDVLADAAVAIDGPGAAAGGGGGGGLALLRRGPHERRDSRP